MASSTRRDSLAASARSSSTGNFDGTVHSGSGGGGGEAGHHHHSVVGGAGGLSAAVGVPKSGHIHLAWRNVQRLMSAVRDSQTKGAKVVGVDSDGSSDDGKAPLDRSTTPGQEPSSRDRSPHHHTPAASTAAHFCTNCRSDGHSVADCHEPTRCYVCHHPGHEAYVCVANPVPASIMFRADERCLICREPGHSAKACKSRGGPQHGRPGVQHIAGGCFPRPLVVHVSADSGPTPAQQRAAREAIAATLPAEMRNRFRSGELSDADLFLAGLSRLGESTDHHDPALDGLRSGLVTMRGPAAAGLVSAVQPPEGALGGGAAALQRTRAAEQEATGGGGSGGGGSVGPPLHELKASSLDFHVVFGGRVSVYRRGKEGADGGKQRSADEEAAAAAAVAGVPLDADIKARLDKKADAAAAARTVQSAPEIVAAWPYKPGDEARFRERRRQQRLADEAKEKAAADAATSRERSARMKMLKSQIDQAESKESARAASARAAAAASRKQQQQQPPQQAPQHNRGGRSSNAAGGFGASRRYEGSHHHHGAEPDTGLLTLDESTMEASAMSPTGHPPQHHQHHAHAAFAAATAATSMAHSRKASLSPPKGQPSAASSPRGGSMRSPRNAVATTSVPVAADVASSRAGDAREALARSLRRTWSARARRVAPQPGSFDTTVGGHSSASPVRAESNTFVTGGGMAAAAGAVPATSPSPSPPTAAAGPGGGGGAVVASHADDLRRRLESGDCRISTRFPGARVNPRLTQWTAAAVRVDPSSGGGGTTAASATSRPASARGPGTAATGTRAPSSRATESLCHTTPRASPRDRPIGPAAAAKRGNRGLQPGPLQESRGDVPPSGDTPRVPNLHLSPEALAAASSAASGHGGSFRQPASATPPVAAMEPRQPEPIKNWRAYSLLHAWKPSNDATASSKDATGHDGGGGVDDAQPDHRATAERWRGRFEMSKLASTYATDVQLEARAVHRSIVHASPRAMAAVCERALSKGRRWLVSHSMGDSKRPSTSTPRGEVRTPRPPSSSSSSAAPAASGQTRQRNPALSASSARGSGGGARRKSMASRMAEAGAAEEGHMAALQRRREEAGGGPDGSDGADLVLAAAGNDDSAIQATASSSASAAAADAEDACPSVWSEACLRMALEAVAVQVRAGVRKDVAAYLGRVKGPRGDEAVRIVAAFHDALDELDRPPEDKANDIAAMSRRSPVRRPTSLAFSTKEKSGAGPRPGTDSSRENRQAFTVSDAEAVSHATRVAALGAADTEPRSIEGLRLLQLIDAVLVDAARTVSGATAS